MRSEENNRRKKMRPVTKTLMKGVGKDVKKENDTGKQYY
jgi:hypothetical protein